jgi:hypothetical protein
MDVRTSSTARRTYRSPVIAIALALGTLLLAPSESPAHAGYNKVAVIEVCGVSGCRELNKPLELFHATGTRRPRAVETSPAPPGPYYELRLQFTRPPPAFFVPATGALRSFPDPFGIGDPVWLRLEVNIEAALRAELEGLEPFPSPMMAWASVGGRAVANPQAYLALYSDLAALPADSEALRDTRSIELIGERLNPWADGYNLLSYEPNGRLLLRDGEVVRPTTDLIRLIEQPTFAKLRLPWVLIALGMAFGILFALAFALRIRASRRRPIPVASIGDGRLDGYDCA